MSRTMKRLPTPMFHASVMVRGSQTRHSVRVLAASHISSETRPTWDMASRVERARQAAAFRRGLLRWYRLYGRDLPWRYTRNPYHIVVSEFMLQQTQVSRVEAYYHRFLEQYPTIHALAAAPPAAVRESWEGLGYYRRASNLHRLAQAVVEQHRGAG